MKKMEENLPTLLDDLQARVVKHDEFVKEQRFRTMLRKSTQDGSEQFLGDDGFLLPPYELGIRLKMMGMNLGIAAHNAKITPGSLMKAYLSGPGQELQKRVRAELDLEFKNLQGLVVDAVAKGLKSEEPQAYLGAANLWFKVEKENKLNIVLSAEDIISKLIEDRNGREALTKLEGYTSSTGEETI